MGNNGEKMMKKLNFCSGSLFFIIHLPHRIFFMLPQLEISTFASMRKGMKGMVDLALYIWVGLLVIFMLFVSSLLCFLVLAYG